MSRRLKTERDDIFVGVGGGEGERGEDVLPAGLDVPGLALHHLRHAPYDHVADLENKPRKKTFFTFNSEIEQTKTKCRKKITVEREEIKNNLLNCNVEMKRENVI